MRWLARDSRPQTEVRRVLRKAQEPQLAGESPHTNASTAKKTVSSKRTKGVRRPHDVWPNARSLWGCESNPRVATMGQPALWSARPMQPPQWGRSLCSSRCLLQICKDLWSSLRIGRGELAEDNSVHVTRAIRTHAFVDALPIVKRPRFAGALALLCYPLLALLVLGKVPDARGVAGLLDLGLRIDYVSLRQSGSESIDGAEIERFTRVARRRRLRRVHTISRDDAALSRLEAKGDPSAALNVTTNKFRFDSLPFPWPTRCGDSLELRQARLFGRGRVRWVLELYRTTTSCPSLS